MTLVLPASYANRVARRRDTDVAGNRTVPREVPVALTYNRSTHAVMLATPADLEDFAVGFSLSEGIIRRIGEVLAIEIVTVPDGIECRMDLATDQLEALTGASGGWPGRAAAGFAG